MISYYSNVIVKNDMYNIIKRKVNTSIINNDIFLGSMFVNFNGSNIYKQIERINNETLFLNKKLF